MKVFDIYSNGFSGIVPDNMGNLQNLEMLLLNYNHLGSGKAGDLDFLSSLTNCSVLKTLAIHVNRFGGVLPETIANLSTQLDLLYLGGNQISGSIPEGIGNLVKLTSIHLGENFLTGNVLSSIGKLQNLGRFDLSINGLSGTIPSSIGNLSLLSYLYLNGNKFEGRIPETLRICKNLQILDLSKNNLNDSIPDQLIAAFEGLITLNLSYNSFTGLFPSDIGNLKNLVELYVDNNHFLGEIPSVLGEITELRILHMQGNNFEGSIPQSFSLLRALESLDLSTNNLSGRIPSELQKLPFLVSLNLSFNHLEGEVPQEGVFKNTSGFSIMGKGNTNLCGGIPELELPKCFNQEAKKKGKALSTKVIVIMTLCISVASILLLLLVFICWRRRWGREESRKEAIPAAPLLGRKFQSWQDTGKAVDDEKPKLITVKAVLDDAEDKQITNPSVKDCSLSSKMLFMMQRTFLAGVYFCALCCL
ncbi:hypothetical protein COLO4_08323 [Corchorus olitorius]|uniref:Uncharacterized protein n=1 Tax=Corchorus olitorius TaxID=93759 RepID=A0A1R3KGD1_9ROSI|nr:hypothetical protein COLO4_08323 [Corchorus olitorius]